MRELFGKVNICENMVVPLVNFSKFASNEQLVVILKGVIKEKRLKEIALENSSSFYFGMFNAVFHKIEKELNEEEKKRFIILSIHGRSRFTY